MGKFKLSKKHLAKTKELKKFKNNMMMLDIGNMDNDPYVFDMCHCCGLKRFDNMKKCSKCKSVYYCSRKCQKYDWVRNGHKDECTLNGKVSVYQKVLPYLWRLKRELY